MPQLLRQRYAQLRRRNAQLLLVRVSVLGRAVAGVASEQEARGRALVEALGPAAQFQRCDVTDPAQVEALVARAVDSEGQLDVMFNNAGIVGCKGPVDELLPEEWKATLDVLLNGVFYGMKYAAAVMKPQGFGSIISMRTSSGRQHINTEVMIALRQTLLPVPVRPAISKCGILAKSTTIGFPETSLPRKTGIFIFADRVSDSSITSRRRTGWRACKT